MLWFTVSVCNSRVSLGGVPPPETGLWRCSCARPSSRLDDWSEPVQIITAADCGWHSGPWKPCAVDFASGLLVFFSGAYLVPNKGPFPVVFTLGCLELRGHEIPSQIRHK